MKAYLQNGVFRAILAILMVVIIFAVFMTTIRGHIEPEIKDVALVIIGALISELKTISGYYYGGMDKSQIVTQNDKTN
jgi:uncharacterized membrane-anchored protein